MRRRGLFESSEQRQERQRIEEEMARAVEARRWLEKRCGHSEVEFTHPREDLGQILRSFISLFACVDALERRVSVLDRPTYRVELRPPLDPSGKMPDKAKITK